MTELSRRDTLSSIFTVIAAMTVFPPLDRALMAKPPAEAKGKETQIDPKEIDLPGNTKLKVINLPEDGKIPYEDGIIAKINKVNSVQGFGAHDVCAGRNIKALKTGDIVVLGADDRKDKYQVVNTLNSLGWVSGTSKIVKVIDPDILPGEENYFRPYRALPSKILTDTVYDPWRDCGLIVLYTCSSSGDLHGNYFAVAKKGCNQRKPS